MLKIIHRINKIKDQKKIPREYGVEIDIRTYNKKLILNHEPFKAGDLLDEYLSNFDHAFIVLEVKEEGIEKKVIEICKKYNIKNYFLLSVSFPFIYLLSKEGIKKIAIRYSEFEDINTCLAMKNKVEWVWIDTFTKLPLDKESYIKLKNANFKICLVSPERWNRPKDIKNYVDYFVTNNIKIDAVMTSIRYSHNWK